MNSRDEPVLQPEQQAETIYRCPGESHPISRAIHLARLSGFYEPCKQCQYRNETGSLSKRLVKQVQHSFQRTRPETLIRDSSFRGIYLNEFDAATLLQYGRAIAEWFWERQPYSSQSIPKEKHSSERISVGHPITPTLVIGCDDRPHSLAVVRTLSDALRQSGCHLVETGALTRPCFSFAVHHLSASGGLYVTGAGNGPEWTGFDVLGEASIPLTSTELQEMEAKTRQQFSRATRSSGAIRIFHPEVPYEAVLGKYFHAIRPLTICCGLSNLRLQNFLERLFIDLSCQLIFIDQPIRQHQFDLVSDPVNQNFSQSVLDSNADLGILIDEDARQCQFFDEQGQLIPLSKLVPILVNHQLTLLPDSRIVIEEGLLSDEASDACQTGRKGQIITIAAEGILPARMEAEPFEMGISKCGRIWFRDTFPQSDVIVTLAFLLQKFSESDRPVSEVMAEVSEN